VSDISTINIIYKVL